MAIKEKITHSPQSTSETKLMINQLPKQTLHKLSQMIKLQKK